MESSRPEDSDVQPSSSTEILNSSYVRQFFGKDFESHEFVHRALEHGTSLETALAKLSVNMRGVETELHQQISEHHEELLSQNESVSKLEDTLKFVQVAVSSLKESMSRLQSLIVDPFDNMQQRTNLYQNMINTTELLRHLLRFLSLVKKLRQIVNAKPVDLGKAARALNDLEQELSEVDLTGINVVDQELDWIRRVRKDLMSRTKRVLLENMRTLNQSEVGSALQVFFNINAMPQIIMDVMLDLKNNIKKLLDSAIDVSGVTRNSGKRPGSVLGGRGVTAVQDSEELRKVVLTQLSAAFTHIASYIEQTVHLERVISKKRDPLTFASFYDVIREYLLAETGSDEVQFVQDLAEFVTEEFRKRFKTQEQGSFVFNACVMEFPKLLEHLDVFLQQWHRLAPDTVDADAWAADVFEEYEAEYLKRAFSRLFEQVNVAFGNSNDIPNPEHITKICNVIRDELKESKRHPRLHSAVARSVLRAVKLMTVKCESLTRTDESSYRIGESLTDAQRHNFDLLCRLDQMHGSLELLSEQIGNAASTPAVISSSGDFGSVPMRGNTAKSILQVIQECAEDIVQPFFENLAKQCEKTLRRLHHYVASEKQQARSSRIVGNIQASPYVRDLQEKLRHLQSKIFAALPPSPSIKRMKRNLGDRLINTYVRQLACVTPLTEDVRLRLVKDVPDVEYAIVSFVAMESPSWSLMLRCVRSLLFREAVTLEDVEEYGSGLPTLIVVHLLMSRGPRDFASLRSTKEMTVEDYDAWLCTTSEKSVLSEARSICQEYLAQHKGTDADDKADEDAAETAAKTSDPLNAYLEMAIAQCDEPAS